MNDVTERVERIRRVLRTAESEQAKLEGRRQQLEERKKEILNGFKELGIKAKDAPKELEKLNNSIQVWLDEAEQKIEEFMERENEGAI